jgi:phosphoribosylformylglycinamidine cyclo-ligase
MSSHYRQAGVDIDAGNEVVRRIKALAKSTHTPGVLGGVGSFGGLFQMPGAGDRPDAPVLVASADGVGTKRKIAFKTGVHHTIGADLVNHCVNDILVQGAEPLFFLDYLATGRLSPDVAEQIVAGVATACRENGCALLGGETAEMPGFYTEGEYDVAGFIVGLVAKDRVIDGARIGAGDALIALPSSGLHTNGYSLARRIVFDTAGLHAGDRFPGDSRTVGDVLLATHRSYLSAMRPLLGTGLIKGMAHITGGGLTENVPRMLPSGLRARIDTSSWDVPPVFRWLQQAGAVSDDEMRRAFNMGVGLVVACEAGDAPELLSRLAAERPWSIGAIEQGQPGVVYR